MNGLRPQYQSELIIRYLKTRRLFVGTLNNEAFIYRVTASQVDHASVGSYWTEQHGILADSGVSSDMESLRV